MGTPVTRYENYLNSYQFYHNNIQFRIISSKALEKWKNVQAFQLNQLVNGKFYFADDRREIILLKYDMWTRWLYELENLFIELGEKGNETITKKDIELIIRLSDKTRDVYKSVIKEQTGERFESKFSTIWLEIHDLANQYLIKSIEPLNGYTFEIVYRKIVDVLTLIMQYTLFEIYELDTIFCKKLLGCDDCPKDFECDHNKTNRGQDKIPFLIVSQLTFSCYKETEVCLLAERLKIYKKYFDIDEIYIKNYTNNTINQSILDNVEAVGVKIDYKKSFVNA